MTEVTKEDLYRLETRLTQAMAVGFDGTHRRLDGINGRVGAVEDKVLVIETERKGEAAEVIKKGSLAGLLGAGGLAGILEAIRAWWS